jgi:hypothetical protein
MKEIKLWKFGLFTIVLIIVLIIRLIAQIVLLENSYGASLWTSSIYAGFIVIYSVAIVGTLLMKKWGSIAVIAIALVDLAFSLAIGGATGVGAGIVDMILLFLVFMAHKKTKKIPKDSKK